MLSGTRQVSGPYVWRDEHLKDFTLALTLLHCQKHSTVKCREIPVSNGEDKQVTYLEYLKPDKGTYLECK